VQTTLTNFERTDVNADDRRFVYEELSFSPAQVDGLGIGLLSISTFTDFAQRRAVKLFRSNGVLEQLYFGYEAADLELFYLTRSLPRMRWDAAEYRQCFDAELDEQHGEVIAAIVAAGLAERHEDELVLTPRGMFFADSIVGLLAERRVEQLRASERAGGCSTQDVIGDYSMG
jgi:oxygen-independent coproporphyrinogen-3 oxidase